VAEPVQRSGDRLPWLTEASKSAPPQPVAKRRRIPLLAFLLGGLFALIGVGAYWLGSRQPDTIEATEERPGMAAQEEHAPADGARLAGEPALQEPAIAEAPPAAPASPATRSTAAPAPVRSAEASSRRPTATVRRSSPQRRQQTSRSVQQSAPELELPVQPVVRGRLIQTGAFPSRAQAEADWRRMVRKWPYLASKPRLIAPLMVRSTDGKATHMYRVQLATASQAQSVVICQQLAKVGQSCVVVY
jgi:hypothetical protein